VAGRAIFGQQFEQFEDGITKTSNPKKKGMLWANFQEPGR
jgi:hypothetical protein